MDTKSTYSIDAAGKSLGRVASEAAKALMGKMRADYVPHKRTDVSVTVSNASKLYIRDRKRNAKIYHTYSGYPGGLKSETLSALSARKKGNGEALRRAVTRMLPRNTMRTARLKNLIVLE
jgi:large subunit ribosomal protein L13